MLTDGFSPVLSMLSHRLLGVHKSVGQINGSMNKWKIAIGAAGAAMVAGGLVKGMVAVAMHGDKFLDQMAKIRVLGGGNFSNQDIAAVQAKAWENTRLAPGSMVDENVKAIGEMYSIVGLAESLKISTKMAQVDQVLKNLTGKEGQAYTIARAGELMSKFTDPKTREIDSAAFNKFLDIVVKTAAGSHGRVGPADWLAFAKQGNVAAGNMTENGLLTTAMTMQAMGGHRAGTAMQAMTRQFVGGVMARRVAEELIRVGILDEAGTHFKKGGAVVIDDGAMRGTKALQEDPLRFMTEKVLPAWVKAGIDTAEKQQKEFYRAFGTGPAQRLAFELIRGEYQMKSERERLKGGAGYDMAQNYLQNYSPLAARHSVEAAWDNMLTALGSSTLQAAIPVMIEITSWLNKISAWGQSHPEALLKIFEGLAILAGGTLLASAGALAVALGPVGWFVGGMVALGAALYKFPAAWIFKGTIDALSKFADALAPVLKSIIDSMTPYIDILEKKAHKLLDGMPSEAPIGDPGGSGFIPPSAKPEKQSFIGNFNVDGRKLASIVFERGGRMAGGLPNSSSAPDYTDNLAVGFA